MTEAEELKIIAVRCHWAYEDLVFDGLCTEWNHLCKLSLKKQFSYLKEKYGSGRAVLGVLCSHLKENNLFIPGGDTAKEQLRAIVDRYPQILEDLTYQLKCKEAREMFETVNGMFRYLKGIHGSTQSVLAALQHITRVQSGRRKTLWLQRL